MILVLEDEPIFLNGIPLTYTPRGEEEEEWLPRRLALGHSNAQWDDAAWDLPQIEQPWPEPLL